MSVPGLGVGVVDRRLEGLDELVALAGLGGDLGEDGDLAAGFTHGARTVTVDADARPDAQNPRRSATSLSRSSIGTRTCSVVSRSRIVTALSSSESKSTVTHSGVPISSWRR